MVYRGLSLVIPDLGPQVIEDNSVEVLSAPAFVSPSTSGEQSEGPLVEFARLADERVQELRAYEEAGRVSREGLATSDEGGVYKAYYRYPLESISLEVERADPPRLLGTIQYQTVVYIQTGRDAKSALAKIGTPDRGSKAVESEERYRYDDGQWTYVED